MATPLKRPTLTAVAQAAGVSTATVDRVLNSRLPVKEATAMRVIAAAERIGYHGAQLMRARLMESGERQIRTLGFCLLRSHAAFYQAFGRELSAAASQHPSGRCVAVVEYMDSLEPAAIAEQMLRLGQETDALGVVAVDHPHVSAAVETLHAQGHPTFALLSDLSAPLRAGYIGVDPRKCGRTAAWAISRLARRPGPVGVFVGSHRYLGHEACEMSLRAYLREHAPDFHVLETRVNLEDAQLAHEATLDLLRRHPDLAGLYEVGGGVQGIIRAVREHQAGQAQTPAEAHHVVLVCNELTPDNRSALVDGVVDLVIGTPTTRIAQTAVTQMLRALDLQASGTPPSAGQFPQAMELFTPENVS